LTTTFTVTRQKKLDNRVASNFEAIRFFHRTRYAPEQTILAIAGDIDPDQVRKQLIAANTNPLMIPARIRQIQQVPKLGSGKTDFAGAKALALSAP